ncbi:uncharacterized protein PAC_19085 [Phialocephala subalpina]|uniref:Heterokaryon incompatibility domain-containing protein n=1 Tax=Phialocephala subalpina TaxID=576137 RepID=A0A1L7XW29_9HELO|nr:uncharacterized protein PAC_19085 [Phialocephala subalpina]
MRWERSASEVRENGGRISEKCERGEYLEAKCQLAHRENAIAGLVELAKWVYEILRGQLHEQPQGQYIPQSIDLKHTFIVMDTRTHLRCDTCKKDHARCTRTGDKLSCDRCDENNYACSLNVEAETLDRKRRKLSTCLPEGRVWDGTSETRCDNCKKMDRPCSEPQMARQGRESPAYPGQQIGIQMSPSHMGSSTGDRMDAYGYSQPSAESDYPASLPGFERPSVSGNGTYNGQNFAANPGWQPAPNRSEISPWYLEQDRDDHLNEDQTYPFWPSNDFLANGEGLSLRYRYKPLRDADATRLIKLYPGELDADLLIDLVEVGQGKQEYDALSYVWGSDPPNKALKVCETSCVLYIQPTLYMAMRNLRKRDHTRHLWVDAICINQQDNKETTAQGLSFGRIYAEASSVIIWLDPGTGSSDTSDNDNPVGLIEDVFHISNFERVVQEESRKERWQALEDLLRNKWFTRLRALQEVACARRAVLHWGKRSVSWEDFTETIALLVTEVDRFSNLRENASFLNPGYACRRLPAPFLVNICNSLFWKTREGVIISRRYTLESLVSILVPFGSNDPRDTIYGLLSLANIDQKTRFVPDYEKDIRDVYVDFVDYCIKQSGSLDIICRHWAPLNKSSKRATRQGRTSDYLPSWVLTSLGSPFATYDDPNTNNRLYGESLVGLPDKKWYNASLGISAWAEFDKNIRALRVRGIEVAKVSITGMYASKGMVLREWLDLAGCPSSDSGISFSVSNDDLWRTLVADRDESGNKAPSWYGRAFLQCVQTPSQDMDVDTQKWINSNQTPTRIRKFLSRVQSVIWNRKFFTTEKGGFGLGPRQAREGDQIYVVLGCSVPILLRKHGSRQKDVYQLIGEVYLHEMMDGQALFGKSEEEIGLQAQIISIL